MVRKRNLVAVFIAAGGLVFGGEANGQAGIINSDDNSVSIAMKIREKELDKSPPNVSSVESADEDVKPRQTNNDWYIRPDAKTRFRRYANNVLGPVSLGRYALIAGIQTARNEPEEWGGKFEGFGRRFASEAGKSAISNTIRYGLDEAFKYDSKFYLSRDKKNSARFRNALISTVAARDENGDRVFAFPKIAGNISSNVIANTTWFPERYGVKDGLKSYAISVGIEAGINLFREFVLKK